MATLFRGLRGRFIGWTLILSLLIGLLSLFVFGIVLRSTLTDLGSDFAVQYTLREKGRLLEPIDREVALCRTMASSPLLLEWTQKESDPALRRRALRELENYRQQFQSGSYFFALATSGHYYYNDGSRQDPTAPTDTLSPRDSVDSWFYSTLENVDDFDLNVDVNPVIGKTNLFLNAIIRSGGRKLGITGTGFALDRFLERLFEGGQEGVEPMLIDGEGVIQAHRNRELITFNPLAAAPGARSMVESLFSGEEQIALLNAMKALASAPDSVALLELGKGGDQVITATYLPSVDWYLVAQIDLTEAVASSNFSPIALLLLVALAATVLAVLFLLNRTVLAPLNALTNTARAISSGQTEVRASAQRHDEVGELATTFNSMLDTIGHYTEQIERARDELELRVKERTAELQVEMEERRRAEQAAHAANHAKSEFLANMSHEIRTPMNAILGFAEILHEKSSNPKHQEYLSIISSSGQALLTLINDILDLSKIEAGKLSFQIDSMSPRRLLRDIEMVFSQKVADKGLQLSVDIAAEVPEAVLLDPSRLRQVLLNLVGNAIKFTDAGFIKVSVDVQPGADPELVELLFRVTDSGIGIVESQVEQIFGAFQQAEGQSHTQYGGTGLGLPISRRLVEAMGGNLSVESNPAKGSTFSFVLPQVEISSVVDLADEEEQGDPETIRFEGARVLIAEDIEVNRELIKGYLADHDLTLLEATNGREAVEIATREEVDLVLMDIKMPELDGYEATLQLRKQAETKALPIIAVTASTMKVEEDKIRDICNAFVRKPISRGQLIEILCGYLPWHRDEGDESPTDRTVYGEEPLLLGDEGLFDSVGLLKTLEQELRPTWEEVSERMIVNEVVHFAEQVIDVSKRHRLQGLASWGDRLRSHAMMFEMDRIEHTLRQFPDLEQQIRRESS